MNRLCCSLSQILRRCRAPAARQRLLHWCSSASRVMMPAVRRAPSTVLGRQYRWYDDPRKALTATAIGLSAAVMAARQVVPGTNRSHLVVLSAQKERDIGESHFAELKHIYRHRTVDPCHPDSVRVRLIADRIIHAANRGLGIYDTRDAPLLRVTRKEKKKKPWARQPHTRHLHGLDACWELVLVSDGRPRAVSSPGVRILFSTGMLDWLKTDGEIAFSIAHEVGHHIARHTADIMNILWLPKFLRLTIIRRAEIEADRIGILLLAAAGFHPNHALECAKKAATDLPHYSVLKHMLESTHPRPKDRLARLSEAKTMEEALELYREATARDKVTGKYFSNPTM